MPQQQKSAKTKKTKLSKTPFFYIVILLIAVVITVCLIVRNNQSKQEGQDPNVSQQEGEQNQEDIPLPQQSLIDLNNTENAKVEGGVKENTSSKLAEPKTYKGLTFKDIKLKAEGGITRLTAAVENNSSQKYQGEDITIVFTNQDGSEYARLEGILPTIEVGKTKELDAATTADIANAYDFRVE